MYNNVQMPYLCLHPESVIEKEIFMAQELESKYGTFYPNKTYEEGYVAALNFILNRAGSNIRDEYEWMMDNPQPIQPIKQEKGMQVYNREEKTVEVVKGSSVSRYLSDAVLDKVVSASRDSQ